MTAATHSYGICESDKFEWLIRRGDLILSTEKRLITSKVFLRSLKSCPGRKFEVTIYRYEKRYEDDDDVPDFFDDGGKVHHTQACAMYLLAV